MICGRHEDTLRAAADRIGAIPIVADVGTSEGATAFVEAASAALGGIDILVPNAGGPVPGNFAQIPVESYPVALDLNLMSVVAMCKAAVPEMQERGWGRVVAITSIAVREPIANLILSNTARAGATAFLKTLAREVAPDGVTVNSVQPGLHGTQRLIDLYGGDEAAIASQIPVGSTGDPEDFGSIVAFLCSDQAKFITGAALHVDGGASHGLQ
ncbi:MAG: 3-oxoacyl-[acyl-carrier protein] reductase [Actinomycetota bacterium]|nr:3-oxoacyl-[acyl-carrier protein] reductase [Actinomycetota bacterium]